MRLNELTIRRYGPLAELNRAKLGEFTLFFGQNEDGKTLIIDALVKLLFNKYREFGEKVKRVDENPDGYVLLEDNGKEIKIPEQGDLLHLFGISPLEGRNIFIIRDSDLTIPDESDYYRKITDKLTGLRTDEIEKIITKLHEIAKLTPQGDFSNRSPELLKTKLKNADQLLRDIEDISDRYQKEDIENTERDLVKNRDKLRKLKEKMRILEEARNRSKYERGTKALENLGDVIEKLKKLAKLDEDAVQTWKIAERDIKKAKEEKKKLFLRFRAKETKLEKKKTEVKAKERELDRLEDIKKKIDEEIKPGLRNFKDQVEEFLSIKEKATFHKKIFIISSSLLVLSVAGLITGLSWFTYLAALFLIISIYAGWRSYGAVRMEGMQKGRFEKLRLEASNYKLEGNTVEEIIRNVQKFEEDYSKATGVKNEIDKELIQAESDINQINKQVTEKEKLIKHAESEIEEIKEKSEINSLNVYTKKLKIKKEKERFQDKQETILENEFGTTGKGLDKNIIYWESEIKSFEKYKDKASNIKFDEKEETKINEENDKLEAEQKELEVKLQEFRKELKDIEREANEILAQDSDYFYCQTNKDLMAIKEKIENFVKENLEKRKNVLNAAQIFNEIQSEEEKRVSNLFGKNTKISKYFSEITGGIYTEVNFLSDKKRICVTRKSGKKLTDFELSAGTYDQLFLTIRLGLGEQLMQGKKGFFIMDDPFIKSDKDRLERQIKLLKKIVNLGWQIIYFSAKEEVKESLKSDIKNNKISFFPLQTIQI